MRIYIVVDRDKRGEEAIAAIYTNKNEADNEFGDNENFVIQDWNI